MNVKTWYGVIHPAREKNIDTTVVANDDDKIELKNLVLPVKDANA